MRQIVLDNLRLSCTSIKHAVMNKLMVQPIEVKRAFGDGPAMYQFKLSECGSVFSEVKLQSLRPFVIDFGRFYSNFNSDYSQFFEYSLRAKLFVFIDYLRTYVVCAIKFPDFGDGILPNLISFVACITYIASKLVQS